MKEIMTSVCLSEAQTYELGKNFASKLNNSAIVLLEGDMGVGKSVFARGVINALGYNKAVTSPTFTLMNEYPTNPQVYHFDMYRLEYPEQLFDIGYEEYIYSDGISLIEWSSKMEYLIPEEYIKVEIERIAENGRKITISTNCEYMIKE